MPLSQLPRTTRYLWLAAAVLTACGADSLPGSGLQNAPDSGVAVPTDGRPQPTGCPRIAPPANRARKVVVSRPYGPDGSAQPGWELLTLSASGTLSSDGIVFEMGRAVGGIVHFTPDGKLGFAAQQDGTIGVFEITESGVNVLHKALSGEFYASSLTVSPAGDQLLVLSANWRNNGGGIYGLAIGCHGEISEQGLLSPAKLPKTPLWRANGDLVISAHDVGNSAGGQDVHILSGSNLSAARASAAVFPDRMAIVESAAMSADEHYLLVGDASGFSGVPNRVAVARLGDDRIEGVQVLSPIESPSGIATSPHNDAAIVTSVFGDAIFKLTYDPTNAAAPWALAGELAYSGGSPALPASVVTIDRGDLAGSVLIAENQGIRRVVFEGNGVVTDKGRTDIGTSFAAIVGAIGVQP